MLNKQSKILTKDQIEACKEYINNTSKFKARDTLIFLLSTLAGLRMHEIANLDWYMVLDSNNTLSKALLIPNKASKGRTGGRAIPLHNDLYNAFKTYLNSLTHTPTPDTPLIPSQKSDRIKSHTLVKLLKHWYT
jgi:integrase/recombinase XerD